jgi:hypothetical protein
MIDQTIRDYIGLERSITPIEQWHHATATCFLFEDGYRINWGGEEKSLQDLLDILDLDMNWVRERIQKLKEKKQKEIRKRIFLEQ